MLEQWIRAKYERQEFLNVDKQTYITDSVEGTLMKKAKDENKYFPRKFVISDNSLKYYSKEVSFVFIIFTETCAFFYCYSLQNFMIILGECR